MNDSQRPDFRNMGLTQALATLATAAFAGAEPGKPAATIVLEGPVGVGMIYSTHLMAAHLGASFLEYDVMRERASRLWRNLVREPSVVLKSISGGAPTVFVISDADLVQGSASSDLQKIIDGVPNADNSFDPSNIMIVLATHNEASVDPELKQRACTVIRYSDWSPSP